MSTDSPFEALAAPAETVEFAFDGQTLRAPAGMNLAAALLAAGVLRFRDTPVSGAPRSAFCMMGACHDCLVEIDGEVVQACMATVAPGLAARRPPAPESWSDD